ncbi:unnamed protein product [Merluccius merluccius]
MAMSRSHLAKKLFEIEELLRSLGKDLPAEMSDRSDGASAPRRHAKRVTSAERPPPLTYDAESSPLIAAVGRTPLTGAESSPLLAAAASSLLITANEDASLADTVERTSLNATERAPANRPAPGRCCVYSHR